MLELDKRYSHRRNKASFTEEDIKYLEQLIKENKSAELALVYIKVVKAKAQQDKQRESSRLSKMRNKDKVNAKRREIYKAKKTKQLSA